MAKEAFNKKKTHHQQTVLKFKEKKIVKIYIWSIAVYGAETWTLQKVN